MAVTAVFSCTDEELRQVMELVGDSVAAQGICTTYDCSGSVAACVLQHLAAGQSELMDRMGGTAKAEVALGLDVCFLLFSGTCLTRWRVGRRLLSPHSPTHAHTHAHAQTHKHTPDTQHNLPILLRSVWHAQQDVCTDCA